MRGVGQRGSAAEPHLQGDLRADGRVAVPGAGGELSAGSKRARKVWRCSRSKVGARRTALARTMVVKWPEAA